MIARHASDQELHVFMHIHCMYSAPRKTNKRNTWSTWPRKQGHQGHLWPTPPCKTSIRPGWSRTAPRPGWTRPRASPPHTDRLRQAPTMSVRLRLRAYVKNNLMHPSNAACDESIRASRRHSTPIPPAEARLLWLRLRLRTPKTT